jgi:hypothetical protein
MWETEQKPLFISCADLSHSLDSKDFMAENTEVPRGRVIDLPTSSSAPYMDFHQLV